MKDEVTDAENALGYTVPEFIEKRFLPLGKSAVYAAIRAGEIPSIRIGHKRIIPKKKFHAMFDVTD